MEIVLYKRRWFILLETWITFAPISSYTVSFYGKEIAPTLFNVIFMICSVPLGFVSMWLISKYGLRAGCLLGAWLNLIGNLLRFYAATEHHLVADNVELRFYLTLAGQTLAACAQPFVMYLPTKLASVWFPDSQRVLANSLGSLSNPLGAATMYALAPHIVNGESPRAFVVLTGIVAALAVLSAVLSLGVLSSRPPTAPSVSAQANESEMQQFGLIQGIKMALKSRSYVILMLGLGSGFGIFNTLYNNLQPALCSKGYANSFSGAMGATMIVSGLVASSIFGIFVDKTRLFQETMKVCMCLAALTACVLTVLTQFAGMEIWLLLTIICFGALALALYPIGLELGVETTYPAPEATSTGLLILTGYLFRLYVAISFLRTPPTDAELLVQTCIKIDNPVGIHNWRNSFIAWNGIIVITAALFSACFWPKYKRMEYEAVGQNQQT
ncbi:major facilitator superfamily domain-containing protein [Ditylenchus destructor]|nr:major facilitator superfamily domain-containing protein [Ditylenchus destructor]